MRAIFKLSVCLFLLALVAAAPSVRADVAILLEEPYSLDGTLAGTGHAAVYLTNICAASPTQLRSCDPGELGIVLSRYHHVAGYDWLAVPVVAYLYAVEKPENIPLFADPKLVWFLRNQYRARHFSEFAPDPLPSGDKSSADWYQLVGSAYDRTLYGFQLPTSPEDDARFIAKYNAAHNTKSYKLVTDNCADFVHDVVTFYYPNSVWRSKIGDIGVMTPKQVAKSLVQFTKRAQKKDPDLQLTRFFVPQVPGTVKRSKPVHGLVDGVFHAKKYFVPLAVFQPFVAGGVATVYYLGGRFDPAKDAALWTPSGLEHPLTKDERKAWESELQAIVNSDPSLKLADSKSVWKPLQSSSEFHLDALGHPVLQVSSGDGVVNLGASRANILDSANAQNEARLLLVARLKEELRGGRTKKSSDRLIRADFNLLQQTRVPSVTLSASTGSGAN